MKRSIQFVAIAIVALSVHGASGGIEFWKFQFAPNGSLPYHWTGEGIPTRADVAGDFTLRLDWERLTGQLWELNGHAVNIHTERMTPSGIVLERVQWESFPIVFQSEPVTFDVGSFTYENGMWKVACDKWLTVGAYDGSYTIAFDLNHAFFNLAELIIDSDTHVIDAPATFVSATMAGDYSGNYIVDAADYTAWRKMDGSENGRQFWQQNFGFGPSGAGSNTAAPEPATVVSLLAAAGLLTTARGFRARNP